MSEEKRLSLSFGNFSFEIVGYDEPFTIMAKVFDLVLKTSKEAPWLFGEDGDDSGGGRKRFAAALNEKARTFDLEIAEIDGRFVVTPPETPAKDKTAPRAEAPKVASRAPLHLSVAADPAPAEAPSAGEEAPSAGEEERAAPEADAPAPEAAPAVVATAPAVEDAAAGEEIVAEDVAADDFEEEIVEAAHPALSADLSDDGVGEAPEVDVKDPEAQDDQAPVAEATAEDEASAAAEAEEDETPDASGSSAPDAARTTTGEGADSATEASPKPAIASRPAPKIVIDRAKSQPHQRRKPQPMHKISATVTRTPEAQPDTAEEPAAASPFMLTSEFSVQKAPVRAGRDAEDDDENFLFAPDGDLQASEPAEAPLALSGRDRVAAQEAAGRKKGLGALGLGIFRRRKDQEEEETTFDGADEDSAFDRLRETAEAQLPKLEEPTLELSRRAPDRALFAVSDGRALDDASSPAVFARQMGAQSLQDLLEASAAYVSIVDGKARFSRRDVMLALSDIGLDKEYTPEARLKSFRKLLTSGAIVRAEDGMFAISHATRFGYETQLRSNA